MKVLNNKLQVLAAQLEQQHHQVEASCEKLGQVRYFVQMHCDVRPLSLTYGCFAQPNYVYFKTPGQRETIVNPSKGSFPHILGVHCTNIIGNLNFGLFW